jgi:xylulokinase
MGLDIGTTGCKAVVFSEKGKILSSGYKEYPLYMPGPSQCELEPEEVWQAIQFVISSAAREIGKKDPVQSLGISTLGDSVTPLDSAGVPLYRTVVGAADRRAVTQSAWIENRTGREELFRLTGAPLHAYSAVPKILWFRENLPDIYKATAKFTGWQEIVHLRLGLKPAMDFSLAGRTMLVDIQTKNLAVNLLNLCEIRQDLFYPLAASHQVLGRLKAEHARGLGLHSGVTVVAGGFDQCCCAMGAGVLDPGTAALSLGTLEAVTAVYDSLRLEQPLLTGNHGCGFHVADGYYISLAYVTTSGAILRWYRDYLGSEEVREAEKLGCNPYELMINSTPERPSGVFVLPYFTGTGTPWLDLDQKGAIFGLSLDTDRREIIKGILDGICYEIRLNLESMRAAGLSIDRLRAVGGGAQSAKWMQLKADLTGVPVEATEISEAGCLGAAFLAGQGLGMYHSAHDINALVKVKKVFEPRSDFFEQYNETYQTYKEIRERVKGLKLENMAGKNDPSG